MRIEKLIGNLFKYGKSRRSIARYLDIRISIVDEALRNRLSEQTGE